MSPMAVQGNGQLLAIVGVKYNPLKPTNPILTFICQKGLDLATRTPTFRDAIILTRRLGIPYIWIDSLSIIQNDSVDWEAESVKMDHVYQNAVITIAAEAASNSSEGFFESMSLREPASVIPQASFHSNAKSLRGTIYFRKNSDWGYNQCRSPLSYRAWTMQEEILSSRILRFSAREILWRYPSAQWRERKPRNPKGFQMAFSAPLFTDINRLPAPDQDWIVTPSVNSKKAIFRYWYLNVVNFYVSYLYHCTLETVSHFSAIFFWTTWLFKHVQTFIRQKYIPRLEACRTNLGHILTILRLGANSPIPQTNLGLSMGHST